MTIIRVLETKANKRADLFTTLVKPVFHRMGYVNDERVNLHQPGRERAWSATSSDGKRRAIIECKATAKPVGEDDLEKFAGLLQAETEAHKGVACEGYFLSVAGFTDAAKEQESKFKPKRMQLWDASNLIARLREAKVICPVEDASEKAGACRAQVPTALQHVGLPELLAHESGWIWAFFYETVGQHGQPTHIALIHADASKNDPLTEKAAAPVIALYGEINPVRPPLAYLSPGGSTQVRIEKARDAYARYIESICGEMQLDGLPADQEVVSRRFRLESLFVPLHLTKPGGGATRQPVGAVLGRRHRLALLAPPGSGKTMLLKRLTMAYTDTERRSQVDDQLPARDWLPVLIRCRQLGERAGRPIQEVLQAIPSWFGEPALADAFVMLIKQALQEKRVLLLIDGLDEIADVQLLKRFVAELNLFLEAHPTAAAVVTAREAGFRTVSGALSQHFERYALADFDHADIERLTRAWHREVIGMHAEAEAKRLAQRICAIDRVRRLAVNPLLLTTLLLVKRWMGQLPIKRSLLYGKAIEVLVTTWNVEGHEPLDFGEVIPQLAFVALRMLKEGRSRITKAELTEWLRQARQALPDLLSYASLSIHRLIDRVEDRSSLLMQSGYEERSGELSPIYEFRHLTFQEYLAALAVVKGYYANWRDEPLLDRVRPHIQSPHWRETISLAAVLEGRDASLLMEHLIRLCQAGEPASRSLPYDLLLQCLLNEVPARPAVLREGIRQIIHNLHHNVDSISIDLLASSKYGQALQEAAEEIYAEFKDHQSQAGRLLGLAALRQIGYITADDLRLEDAKVVQTIERWLSSQEMRERIRGALATMQIAFNWHEEQMRTNDLKIPEPIPDLLRRLGDGVARLLACEERQVQLACCWALAELGRTRCWKPDTESVCRLVAFWQGSKALPENGRHVAWALCMLPLLRDRQAVGMGLSELANLAAFVQKQHSDSKEDKTWFPRQAALVVGYYLQAPWPDAALQGLIAAEFAYGPRIDAATLYEIAQALKKGGGAEEVAP